MSTNYIFEGDIDVYAELNKIVNNEETTYNNSTSDSQCLISGDELNKHHIRLNCGHCFNYIPLLNDVKIQKQRWYIGKPVMDGGSSQRLTIGQIKCPFCRNVQNELLPYIPELCDIKMNGVNHPLKYCMYTHKCQYIYKSGKNNGQPCNKKCNDLYCSTHIKTKAKKTPTEKQKCSAIIKTGKNKGEICGCIAKFDGLCGKHKK